MIDVNIENVVNIIFVINMINVMINIVILFICQESRNIKLIIKKFKMKELLK